MPLSLCCIILFLYKGGNAVWFGVKVHSQCSMKRLELLLKDFKHYGLCLHPSLR